MGSGMTMEAGDIAFKCNFAHMDLESRIVELRRVDTNFTKEAESLCKYLHEQLNSPNAWPYRQNVTIKIQYATEHRCAIVVKQRGSFLSDKISGTDPLVDG